eukprot:TRINITY_DN23749_c0_g1_i1.p1 TRINITY_DN23749_c0_g1~~TRINITY_DN23749_c0_g1_i1.p1  ORF type:complete len:344 (-),score=9.29 TRINITY_DN23749_c0_g1_i1:132-1055(-)
MARINNLAANLCWLLACWGRYKHTHVLGQRASRDFEMNDDYDDHDYGHHYTPDACNMGAHHFGHGCAPCGMFGWGSGMHYGAWNSGACCGHGNGCGWGGHYDASHWGPHYGDPFEIPHSAWHSGGCGCGFAGPYSCGIPPCAPCAPYPCHRVRSVCHGPCTYNCHNGYRHSFHPCGCGWRACCSHRRHYPCSWSPYSHPCCGNVFASVGPVYEGASGPLARSSLVEDAGKEKSERDELASSEFATAFESRFEPLSANSAAAESRDVQDGRSGGVNGRGTEGAGSTERSELFFRRYLSRLNVDAEVNH